MYTKTSKIRYIYLYVSVTKATVRSQCQFVGLSGRRSNMSSTDLLNNRFNNEAFASFLNNVTSKDLTNVIYDGSRLKWCNDLTSLKTFVTEVLCQEGKWRSPGGYTKKFISSNAELTLTWHQGKQNTLMFQGKDGNFIRDKLISLCRAQSYTIDTEPWPGASSVD